MPSSHSESKDARLPSPENEINGGQEESPANLADCHAPKGARNDKKGVEIGFIPTSLG